MRKPPLYRLSDAEKDALLLEQAVLIERLAARITLLTKITMVAGQTHSARLWKVN